MNLTAATFEFHLSDVYYPVALDKKLNSMHLRHGYRFDEPMHIVLRYAHHAHRMQKGYGNLAGLMLGGELMKFSAAMNELITVFQFDREDIVSILIMLFRHYGDKGLSDRVLENNFALWLKYWPFVKENIHTAYACMCHFVQLAQRSPTQVYIKMPHTGSQAWQTHGLNNSELDSAYKKLLSMRQ